MKELFKLKARQLKGKRVLLRLDLNVPIIKGRIIDRYRIERALPTIHFLKNAGAKISIISHLGRTGDSLKPVAQELNKLFDVGFIPAPLTKVPALLRDMQEGEAVLLENLRRDSGEEKGSRTFAKQLAILGDIYVNDAFAVSHRTHASICQVPKLLPHYAGPLIVEEVRELSRAFKPKRPFVLVLGGAKFETKVPVLKRFIHLADKVYVVGAIAHVFYRGLGYELGKSLIDTKVSAKPYLAALKSGKIVVPMDVLVSNGSSVELKKASELLKGDSIVDSGPLGLEEIRKGLKGAHMVLWNGPSGNYEEGYGEGTCAIARMIAKTKAHSIVGGGDTLAAIQKIGNGNKFSFVSTGGGAMLDFLADGTLPGLTALK